MATYYFFISLVVSAEAVQLPSRMAKGSKVFLTGIFLAAIVCAAYWKFALTGKKEDSHRITKRQSDSDFIFNIVSVPDEEENGVTLNLIKTKVIGFEEHPPGYLVCKKRKELVDNFPPKITAEIEEPPNFMNDVRGKKGSIGVVSMSSLSPNRYIGCCPPGDSEGQVYRFGSSCCIDQVYNTSSHFCCLAKERVLPKTDENLDYCYPINGIPYCREIDLGMETKRPMRSECRYNDMGTPISCQFTCPSGTRPKDEITKAKCDNRGVWNSKPTCCEGCPDTLRLDVWFLVEVTQEFGKMNFRRLLTFLKDLLSYVPVSQNRVRVGITIFNRVVFYDVGVWYLNEHNSHDSINAAIDEIPMEGTGVNTGAAISWVANNAFTRPKGNRADTENLVVTILQGAPEDPFIEPARELKAISKVISIGIGYKISDDDLAAIASSRKNVYRSRNFKDLPELNKVLFKSICGQTCILQKSD